MITWRLILVYRTAVCFWSGHCRLRLAFVHQSRARPGRVVYGAAADTGPWRTGLCLGAGRSFGYRNMVKDYGLGTGLFLGYVRLGITKFCHFYTRKVDPIYCVNSHAPNSSTHSIIRYPNHNPVPRQTSVRRGPVQHCNTKPGNRPQRWSLTF